MKKDAIITLPNKHLRQKSAKVHVITDEIKQLINDMTNACLDWENSRPHEVAAALAAVQIDRLERVVIVRADFDDKQNREFVALINPEIVKTEGKPIIIQPEGCLSIKDVYGMVPRHTRVRVKARNIHGKEIRVTAEGFLARIFQHEIDHTNGKLFIDHIKDKEDAFYKIMPDGKLEPLEYAEHIKDSKVLWGD